MYAPNLVAHRCMRMAAIGGIPFFGPKMVIKGLWSVRSMNFMP